MNAERRSLDDLPEFVTTRQAAEATHFTKLTILRAIRSGELKADRPRGRDPQRFGRSGYRIPKAELERWYFGAKEDE